MITVAVIFNNILLLQHVDNIMLMRIILTKSTVIDFLYYVREL